MDTVETYVYDTDIRIKAVSLSKSLDDVFSAQNIPESARPLFSKAATLAAVFASEEKDDDGSIFVSVKDPKTKTALTVLCETDGRLRGNTDVYSESSFNDTVLTVGRRLVVRGDYQSAVMGKTVEDATREYFLSSRQTKAKTAFFGDTGFFFAEYFPGHDVNYRAGAKKADAEYIEKKLCAATAEAEKIFSKEPTDEKLKKLSETPVVFGCTCTKRKIKNALANSENISFPAEVKCRFCGKTYIIEE